MEDETIVELLYRRDEGALEELEGKYGPGLLRLAGRFLKSREDVEEAVNDTWLAAWNTIPPQRPASLKGYAGRIVRNLALSIRRADAAQKRGGGQTALALDELSEVVSGGETPEGALDRQAFRAALDGFLGALQSRDRNLFLRRYWYLDSVEALSKRFSMSKTQVTTTLHRLRGRLRVHLQQEGFDL